MNANDGTSAIINAGVVEKVFKRLTFVHVGHVRNVPFRDVAGEIACLIESWTRQDGVILHSSQAYTFHSSPQLTFIHCRHTRHVPSRDIVVEGAGLMES
jgi:hypothetical protein